MFCVFKHDSREFENLKFTSQHRDFTSASQAMQNAQMEEFAKMDKLTSGKAIGCGSDGSANISCSTDEGLVNINFYVVDVPIGEMPNAHLPVEFAFPSWRCTAPGEWADEGFILQYGPGDKDYIEISLYHEATPEEDGIDPYTLHIFDGDEVIACHGVPNLAAAKRYACPVCHNEEHLPGARFCMICGTPIEEPN